MKFYLITFLSVILITGTAMAQHVNFGIKGGVNLYDIPNNNNFNYDMKVGLHIGMLAHIHVADHFAIQPEVVFSTQGATYPNNNEDRLILHYVNIPVLFQYMFDNGFRLQAGPQLGVLVTAKQKIGDLDNDVKDNFNPIDFGVTAGASYVHPPSGFGVDARVNIGVNNINKNGTVNSSNRGLQLGVFYLFGHKS